MSFFTLCIFQWKNRDYSPGFLYKNCLLWYVLPFLKVSPIYFESPCIFMSILNAVDWIVSHPYSLTPKIVFTLCIFRNEILFFHFFVFNYISFLLLGTGNKENCKSCFEPQINHAESFVGKKNRIHPCSKEASKHAKPPSKMYI